VERFNPSKNRHDDGAKIEYYVNAGSVASSGGWFNPSGRFLSYEQAVDLSLTPTMTAKAHRVGFVAVLSHVRKNSFCPHPGPHEGPMDKQQRGGSGAVFRMPTDDLELHDADLPLSAWAAVGIVMYMISGACNMNICAYYMSICHG
jgi:hypothetical protein